MNRRAGPEKKVDERMKTNPIKKTPGWKLAVMAALNNLRCNRVDDAVLNELENAHCDDRVVAARIKQAVGDAREQRFEDAIDVLETL